MRRVDWHAGFALLLTCAVALLVGASQSTGSQALAQQVPTPVPTPFTPMPATIPTVPPTASPAPSPTPSPSGRRGRRGSPAPSATGSARPTSAPQPTATPTSPAFSSLDGGWEVQVQQVTGTSYSRFAMRQDGSTVTGTWYLEGKELPFDGSYDGRLFRFIVKAPAGAMNLTGYVENSTDMVGIVDNGKGDIPNVNPIAFTAEHRVPYKANPFKKDKKDKPSG
jgi:hypothetical protein